MSKFARNAEGNNRKLTEFFTRRGSAPMSSPASQPPFSSQPLSSQPRLSQQTSSPAKSQRLTKATKKNNAPPGPDKEVISLSSDSGPIVISSDTSKSHISISSNSTSPLAVSDSNSPKNYKPTITTSQPSLPAKAKKKSTRTSTTVPPQSSTAKTTVKKRLTPGVVPIPPPRPSLPKAMRSPKRKRTWESSTSSEESDGRIYVPKPSSMKPSLTQAPVPRILSKAEQSFTAAMDLGPSSSLTSLHSVRSQSSSKRARLNATTSVSGNDADEEELIPSSQSDEQELMIPKKLGKDPEAVKVSVNKWRRESSVVISPRCASRSSFPLNESPATPPATSPAELDWPSDAPISALPTDEDPDMHIEDLPAVEESGSSVAPSVLLRRQTTSEGEVDQQLNCTPTSTASFHNLAVPSTPAHKVTTPVKTSPSPVDVPMVDDFRPLTPPPSASPPKLHSTPVALTAEQKTTLMIERLKAEAAARAAAARDSSDEEPPSFHDSGSDSSDEELFHDFRGKGKAKTAVSASKVASSSKRSSRVSSPEEKEKLALRYSMRRRSSPTSARTSVPEVTKPVVRKTTNPLDRLLREKKTADKKGTGIDSLRAAEAFLADSADAKGKGKMKAEMDDEESDDGVDWGDEVAAMRAVIQTSKGIGLGNSSAGGDDSDNEGEDFAVDAATRLLGGDEGKAKAVNSILTKDRIGWLGKKRAKKAVRGVSLWGGAPVDGKQSLPGLNSDEQAMKSMPQFLQAIVAAKDEERLSRCLIPQLFSTSDRSDLLALLPWLTSVALSSLNDLLSQRSIAMITYIARKFTGTPLEVSPLALSCLRALGANSEFFSCVPTHDVEVRICYSPLLRGRATTRLVHIIRVFTINDAVATEDISNLVTTLLLIGLDPSTSISLRTDIAVLIDTLCGQIPSNSDGISDMEPVLCARLLKLSANWSVMNKAYMLSLLRGGTPQVVRISRWLGYTMLLGVDIPAKAQYVSLPELEPIMKLLLPSSTGKGAFNVMGNVEKDDFCEQLSYHVELLEAVLNDVEAFVQEEKRNPVAAKVGDGLRPGSPERPEPELEQIVELLEKIHGKINDSRAGDLERSRVKASLQHCWSRVRYQRSAALRAGSAGRPRNLRGYFPRPVPALKT